MNEEWDIDDEEFFDIFADEVDFERRIAEKTISNEYYLIHNTDEIAWRTYIIKELDKIYSILSNN